MSHEHRSTIEQHQSIPRVVVHHDADQPISSSPRAFSSDINDTIDTFTSSPSDQLQQQASTRMISSQPSVKTWLQTDIHLLPLLTAACALISSLANLVCSSTHPTSSWYTWTSALLLFLAVLLAVVSQFRRHLWPFHSFLALISTDALLRVCLLVQLISSSSFESVDDCNELGSWPQLICLTDRPSERSPFNHFNVVNSLTLHVTCLSIQLLAITVTVGLIWQSRKQNLRQNSNKNTPAFAHSVAGKPIETSSFCLSNQNVASV